MDKDAPWLMRTYAGHSSAAASNALFRENLARGQTGLSVAFDLPTQCGYDPDHPLARGEVGKVGAPVSTIEDMGALFEGIPIERMNTSMTINATAPWLLALYVALAERRGVRPADLAGTTQNDVLKEYLSRGTYAYPPGPSLRLTCDVIRYAVAHVPRWNPINVCSYHLQEAGATPVEEVAYALAAAVAVLDEVKAGTGTDTTDIAKVFGRISFFVNSSARFIEETCKMRAFARLWDGLGRERYGVADPAARRFRYGVQVNSLGLTAQQPENNVARIVLSALGVLLSRDARARALQLPAWNEALGLPRPWDQQWSLRIQQVLAHETDLLEHADIFEGSKVVEEKTDEIARGARAELERVLAQGGAVAAIESGYMKARLVASNAARIRRIERGEQVVVGLNRFTESAESPLTAGGIDARILKVDLEAERAQIARLDAFRSRRDPAAARAALDALRAAARDPAASVMPPSIRCAHAGVTTGEWAQALRDVFGDYRAPTGLNEASGLRGCESFGSGAHRAGISAERKEEESLQLGKVAGVPTTQRSGERTREVPRENDSQPLRLQAAGGQASGGQAREPEDSRGLEFVSCPWGAGAPLPAGVNPAGTLPVAWASPRNGDPAPATALRAEQARVFPDAAHVGVEDDGNRNRTLTQELRAKVDAAARALGRRPRFLVAKPGLDGHSNGAEQLALRARDAGLEVVYQGIRLTPEEIARAALDEDVDALGLSILSGSHLVLVPEVLRLLAAAGLGALPVFAGGIIPPEDAAALRAAGVRRVFTPLDFSLDRALIEVVDEIARTPLWRITRP